MSVPDGAVAAAEHLPSLAARSFLIAGLSKSVTDRLTGRIADAARVRGASVALMAPGQGQGRVDRIHRFEGDFGSESIADGLLDSVAFGQVDTIIAVLTVEPIGALHEVAPDQWRERIAEPLRAVFWLTRSGVEHFLGSRVAGRIVLVVSRASDLGSTAVVEGALRSFARSFAREYGRRALAFNVVLARAYHGGREQDTYDVCESVIEHTLFLASSRASFMNGETLITEAVRVGPMEE